MFPIFRKKPNGCVSLADTNAASVVKAEHRKWEKPESYESQRIAARRQCREAGGDESEPKQWMGFLRIQYGSFRGETYRWLIENTPGYCGWMVNKLKGESLSSSDQCFMYKMTFMKYVSMFPEGQQIIALKAINTKADSARKQQTTTLVGAVELGEMDSAADDDLLACLEKYETSVEALDSGKTGSVVTGSTPKPARQPTPVSTQILARVPTPVSTLKPARVPTPVSTLKPARVPTPVSTLKPAREPTPISTPEPGPGTTQGETEQVDLSQDPVTQLSSQVDDIPLTKKWKKTLPAVDQGWISKTFFHYATRGPQFDFNRVTKLWYDPPQPSISRGVLNKQECFFGHRLFLWMPRHLFQYNFTCPHLGCQGSLVNSGVHQKTRMVLDVHDYYIIVGENYECRKCKRKIISWSHGILGQLDPTERSKFPCILTDRYACDMKVIRMMRQRTLGNSSSLVCKQITENHGETYLDKCRQYATNFMAFKTSAAKGLVTIPAFVEPPAVMDIPRHRWFMKVYQLDVISRLEYELAELTSITGDILKIDSTKKITNKLAGASRGTAMWATNVGNEHGQILMSVLTEGEGEGLKKMLDGIVARYGNAGVPPPKVLYTDRDCCGRQCVQKYFDGWPFLHVKLDSWHFMRRFPNGCTTDKHQLYGPFMARLSGCIFKICHEDYALLMRAKREELVLQGVVNPSEQDVIRRITSHEVGRHCKRSTRGVKETTDLIGDLIASLDGERGLDSSGVPLIDSVKMADIWAKQSQHVACLQDPPGVRLYLRVSTVKKGGIELPVYKCARGSTSLENFHLHMARFIPGTLAKDTNFQVYLLDGIFRWNADRGAEATASENKATLTPRTYSGPLMHHTNILWQKVCGKPFFPNFKPPAKYTGELVGVQYLYDQTGQELPSFAQTVNQLEEDEDVNENMEDEGFVDQSVVSQPEETAILPPGEERTPLPLLTQTEPLPPRQILHIPSEAEYRQMATETNIEGLHTPMEIHMPGSNDQVTPSLDDSSQADVTSSDVLGPDNVPGYDKVLHLAKFLVELRDESALSSNKVQHLISLWEQLSDYDKKRTIFPSRYTKKPWSGKFGGRGKHVAPGVESVTKVLLGPNRGPAQWPNCNRYTEATCELLLRTYPGDQKRDGRLWTRWRLVLRAFHNIRQAIVKSYTAMQKTDIQLPLLNKKTLLQWYNKEDKAQEQKILLQGIDMPKPTVTTRNLPKARQKPAVLPSTGGPSFTFKNPPCTAGLARKRISRKRKSSTLVHPTLAPILPSQGHSIILPSQSHNIRHPVIMEQPQVTIPVQPTVIPPPKEKPTSIDIPPKTRRYYSTPDFVKCCKCGENRKNSSTHKSYMFKIYCQQSENTTFEEWRNSLKKEMDEIRKLKKKK